MDSLLVFSLIYFYWFWPQVLLHLVKFQGIRGYLSISIKTTHFDISTVSVTFVFIWFQSGLLCDQKCTTDNFLKYVRVLTPATFIWMFHKWCEFYDQLSQLNAKQTENVFKFSLSAKKMYVQAIFDSTNFLFGPISLPCIGFPVSLFPLQQIARRCRRWWFSDWNFRSLTQTNHTGSVGQLFSE